MTSAPPTKPGAAAALLDVPVPDGYPEEWARHFATPREVKDAGTHAVVIFRLGSEWLAVPLGVVREVAELRGFHSLPHRRSGIVLGLTNVRGELLVCVSLAQAISSGPAAAAPTGARTQAQRLLVIAGPGGRFACPVDEVHGIQRYHPRDLKDVPATVGRAAGTHTSAVLPWKERAVGILDAARLFATLDRSLA